MIGQGDDDANLETLWNLPNYKSIETWNCSLESYIFLVE